MPQILFTTDIQRVPGLRMTIFEDGMVRYQLGEEVLGELAVDIDHTNDTPEDLLVLSIDESLEESLPPRISLPVPVGGAHGD